MGHKEITPKQQRFVEEYLVDMNATQAAIRAGYSKQTANQQGPRLLVNVGVSNAIAEGQKRLTDKVEIKAEEIVRGLLKEATREGPGASHGARVAAWTQLAKHKGMFVADQTHPDNVPVEFSLNIRDDIT